MSKRTRLSSQDANRRKEVLFTEADHLGRFPSFENSLKLLVPHNFVLARSVHNKARLEWLQKSKKEDSPKKRKYTKRQQGPKLFLSSTGLRAEEQKLLNGLLELLGFDAELNIRREGEAVVGFIRVGGLTAPLEGFFK